VSAGGRRAGLGWAGRPLLPGGLAAVHPCAAAVLAEVIKAFSSPENAQRMEEARDNACNDMGKMLQFLLPVATQIQQDVIKAYGFTSDGEGGPRPGGLGGRRGAPSHPLPSRGPQVRPADQILRVAGPGDRQHGGQAEGHVPAAHDAATARGRGRRSGDRLRPRGRRLRVCCCVCASIKNVRKPPSFCRWPRAQRRCPGAAPRRGGRCGGARPVPGETRAAALRAPGRTRLCKEVAACASLGVKPRGLIAK